MATDILEDENGDVSILNGDFEIGFSDEQHQEDILLAFKGEYKQAPLVGLGVESYIYAPISVLTRQNFEKNAMLQFQADNAKNIAVDFAENGEIKIQANYE